MLNRIRWKRLIVLVISIFIIAYSVLFLQGWWFQNILSMLDHYAPISAVFAIVCLMTALFYVYTVKEKGVRTIEKRSFYFLGPFASLIANPLAIATAFYTAMVGSRVILREYSSGELAIDQLIFLATVMVGIMYWSVYELYLMLRDLIYIGSSAKVESKNQES